MPLWYEASYFGDDAVAGLDDICLPTFLTTNEFTFMRRALANSLDSVERC